MSGAGFSLKIREEMVSNNVEVDAPAVSTRIEGSPRAPLPPPLPSDTTVPLMFRKVTSRACTPGASGVSGVEWSE